MNHRDLIPYRQIKTKYKTFTYIMDVLHMFATAKTGDSHMTDGKASNAWS